MHYCCCTSMTPFISFVLFSFVYSSPLTTSNQYSSNRMHIPIPQNLNSDAVRETNQHQSRPSSIGLHISYTHLQYINPAQQTRQRRHVFDKTPQHQNQNSSIGLQISPALPQNINATPQTRKQRLVDEETPQPQNQNTSNEMHISSAESQSTSSPTKQQRHVVEEMSQLQKEMSSRTVQSPSLTQIPSPVLRTRRQYIPPDTLQLPNGPPMRFQRPRTSLHATRQPIRSQLEQQNHGNILQQRYGDVMQQRHDDVMQQSNLLVHSDKRPHGAPQKFCNMFGCDCVPPAGAKCCVGYRYDKRSNKCRQLA